MFAGWDGRVTGAIGLAALPLPEATAVIAELHRRRLRTLLLSGDRQEAVERIAAKLEIGCWHAELLPIEKVHALRDWEAEIGSVAMVGDGLNDGPVLAAAGVGIAVGHATDLARESADVVLPPARLDALPWLLDLATAARRSLRTNLAWAFAYNAVGLTLAASGLLQPVIAAALMAGSSVLVALRSWRASTMAAAQAQRRRTRCCRQARRRPLEPRRQGARHMKRPPVIVSACMWALVLACGAVAGPASANHNPSQSSDLSARGWPIEDFSLTDHNGKPFTQQMLQGRWTFVLLGDTRSVACTEALDALVGLYKRIAPTEALKTTQVLFVSLDPQRDSPGRLAGYLAPFDARFIGGTAAPAVLGHLADDIHGGRATSGPGQTASLVLVGPDGTVRAEFLPPFDVELLTAEYLKTRVRK